MTITITTLAFGELPYLRYTEAINRQYCQQRGYRFEVARPEFDASRSPVWYKVSAVREFLTESDYVLFLDADAYIRDPSKAIEELASDHMNDGAILFGTNRRDRSFAWSDTEANCGVFLVRQCAKAFEILDEWWESPLRYNKRWLWWWPPEQGAFNAYVLNGSNSPWIRVIHYAHMNGVDGHFIRHLIGFTDEERLLILRSHVADSFLTCAGKSEAVPARGNVVRSP